MKKSVPPFPPSSTPNTNTNTNTSATDNTGTSGSTSGTGTASGTASGTATAAGTDGTGKTPPPKDAPQDCQPPPDATVDLPTDVVLVEGKPVRSIKHVAEQTTPMRQVFTTFISDCDQVFFTPGQGYRLPELRQRFDAMCIMRSDMDEDLEQQAHPTNFKLVPDAGQAVLDAATQVPGGEDMEVDTEELTKKLTRLRFLNEQRQGQNIYDDVLDANIAAEENDINKIVRDGVGNVTSLLKRRTRLRNVLGPAIDFIKRNAVMAVDSRRGNERLVDKVLSGMGTGTEPAQPGTATPAGQAATPGTSGTHPATGTPQPVNANPAAPPNRKKARSGRGPRSSKKKP